MSNVDKKLAELGITLPTPVKPIANYVGVVRTGNLVIVSGQLCLDTNGKLLERHVGKVGAEVSPEDAAEAARFSAINVLAQLKTEVGDLDKVKRCVRLGGFINADPNFAALATVMNGASDLMVEVFGREIGAHARSTIGVAELPLGVVVEVEGMFEV